MENFTSHICSLTGVPESRILVSGEFHLPENHRLQHVSGEPR